MANTFVMPIWVRREGVRVVLDQYGLLTPRLADIVEQADEEKLAHFERGIMEAFEGRDDDECA